MKKKVTIKDIARATGFSRGTVDRVLNNRQGVAEETRKKVMAKIKELNYRPDRIAQSLALQRDYDLRVIMPGKPRSFYSQIRAGITAAEKELKAFGLRITVHPSESEHGYREQQLLEQACREGADGVAIMPVNTGLMRENIDQAAASGTPVLTIVSDVTDSQRFCYIGLDNYKGGRLAGELMGKFLNGRGQVAVMLNHTFNSCNQKRADGFSQIMASDFPGIEIVDLLENRDREELAYSLTGQLLQNYPDLKGIFVTNVCAPGAARALLDSGQAGKVRLIGFDITSEITGFLKEGVIYATISQEPFMQGYKAIRSLYEFSVLGEKPAEESILTLPKVMFTETLLAEDELYLT